MIEFAIPEYQIFVRDLPMTFQGPIWAQLGTAFQRRVIKTPIVFFFQVIAAIVVFMGMIGWSNISPIDKSRFFSYGFYLIMAIVIYVMVGTKYWAKNIMYGGEEHLEERRIEQYGSDAKPITAREIELLAGTTRPQEETRKAGEP